MKSLQRPLLLALATAAMGIAMPASASMYTLNYGTLLAGPSDCDDCASAEIAFGAGQTLAFFGASYGGLFVSSNGYVTFGSPATSFSPQPLDTQTVGKMIAGLFTDLDSRGDAASNVYYNDSSLGQLVVTWSGMGHFSQSYSVRSTFQLVIRSDQFTIPSGEGQIGFYYDDITDSSIASAGFGDGLAQVNVGELALASQVAGNTLSNRAASWYSLNNSAPVPVTHVPEPGSLALAGLALMGMALVRRRSGTC